LCRVESLGRTWACEAEDVLPSGLERGGQLPQERADGQREDSEQQQVPQGEFPAADATAVLRRETNDGPALRHRVLGRMYLLLLQHAHASSSGRREHEQHQHDGDDETTTEMAEA